MGRLPGPGPVFEYEWRIGARRKQVYALRSLFVGGLLVALWVGWWETPRFGGMSVQQRQAQLAMQASYAITGTMLALVLLVAPAATAGAICQEKARGTLAHMLVTDLTNPEIVLGKLLARLTPVLTLIACALPVVLICSMMGGVDPNATAGAFAVAAAVAVLGCSLALWLSIRARKTHEVLLLVYLAFCLWLLGRAMVPQVQWTLGGGYSTAWWLANIDPFLLAFAPYDRAGPSVGPWQIGQFVAGCLALSAAFLTLAVRQVRRYPVLEASRPVGRRKSRWVVFRAIDAGLARVISAWERFTALLPGPSLDSNPVLWREWHRNRPSRAGRIAWAVYGLGAAFFTLVALANDYDQQVGWNRGRTSLWVNGFQVAIGLLLLSVGAATSLAEERARGSLDVLMTTPLSTRAIVWGKWLGTFRRAPWLAALPTVIVASLALGSDRLPVVPAQLMLIFAYVAFITSLGLALATWTPRLGRAVAACVAIDVLITAGFFFGLAMILRGPQEERMFMFSPFAGPAVLAGLAGGMEPNGPAGWSPTDPFWFLRAFGWEVVATLVYAGAAALLLFVTLRVFDRKLGRAGAGPLPPWARAPRPPAPLTFAAARPESH